MHLSFGREGNYPDRRWDVSQVGFVFVAKKEWRLSKKAKQGAKSKIDEWNQYLSGDVWGYVVELPAAIDVVTYSGGPDGPHKHVHRTSEESCWGFYGLEYCKEEARGIAEHYSKKFDKIELETALAETMP